MNIDIVLVHPEIPHNTGAIGRLCVGLGARLHLVRPLGFSIDDASLKRSGMDYWQHLDITVHKNWEAFIDSVNPTELFFASTRGKRDIYDCQFGDDVCLVFGNESGGLPEYMYAQYAERLVRIPMPGEHARSINLANAVSIAAYEAYRQGNRA